MRCFDKIEIGKRLVALRKSKKLSQQEFGATVSASKSQVNNMEKGRVNCGIDFVINIALVYRVNLNHLIFGEGEMLLGDNEIVPPCGSNHVGSIENFEQIVWLIRRSPFFHHLLTSYATKLLYENESTVLKDIENYNKAEEKQEH